MQKEKFIVLDCEGLSGKIPYNIGFIIADRYGKIYKKYSFALPENIMVNIMQSAKTQQAITMTAGNVQEILQDFSKSRRKRKYKCVSNNWLIYFLLKTINKYKIKKIYAYNVSFDKTCLKHLFNEKFEELQNLVEFIDIVPIILHTKLLTEKYVNFCIKNEFFTATGKISTKAENVYRYLFNDITFEEEHTGLNDVLIEYAILLKAFETHKKIVYKPCQAWNVLEKFCKEKGIEVGAVA
jgi:hypothetical protein